MDKIDLNSCSVLIPDRSIFFSIPIKI